CASASACWKREVSLSIRMGNPRRGGRHAGDATTMRSAAPLSRPGATATHACGGRRADNAPMPSAARPWFLYLIECANGAWYAGISPDVDARARAHASGRGARYTRANPPVRLLGTRAYPDRASAARAEWAIRKLPRARKLAFLADAAVDP